MLVALTRERGRNDALARLVASRAETVEVPLTRTEYRDVAQVAADALALDGAPFRALVVTSSRALAYLDAVSPVLDAAAAIYSVGPATSAGLGAAGRAVRYQSSGTALDLAPHLEEESVLILGARGGREELRDVLVAQGRRCELLGCYETLEVDLDEEDRALLGRCVAVFIGAPSAWRAAREWLREDVWVIVPGTTTAEAVRADGRRAVVGWGDDFDAAWAHVVGEI